VLNAGGTPGHLFGPVGGAIRAELVNLVAKQTLHFLPTRMARSELVDLTALVDDGKVTPIVSGTYPLPDTAAGVRRVEEGHVRGKLVVTFA
jgi:NADPH:quinone reductase-like Zn-dependent oxidoreductase